MIILDENIPDKQRLLLARWRIAAHQIGQNLGGKGMTDGMIIQFPHHTRRSTFFTRDFDYYRRDLRHERYCLVWLDIKAKKVAEYIRRVLRQREYNTQAKRMGSVISAAPSGLTVWKPGAEQAVQLPWTLKRRR